LLVPSYTASLERDVIGTLVTLWRCVNCGDCVDRDILANRWNGPMSSARETAGSRANIVFPQPVKNGVLEVRMPKTEEAKKNAITVKIDHVLVSRVSSQERSSRHG
jgi:heterodisulfide reductase subunit C